MRDFSKTRFYQKMNDEIRTREMSIRQFAAVLGISYSSLIEFYNVKAPFRPLSTRNAGKIHNVLGIPYELIDEYNAAILHDRAEQKEG